ncbi:MAG: hypothetical protein RBT74_15710 [Tenuifilaceae bacterium]|jgi:tetratricopeptide (TPR) repeat protein|nr:hypothetical protein [Tenuifilaceae bacterium]
MTQKSKLILIAVSLVLISLSFSKTFAQEEEIATSDISLLIYDLSDEQLIDLLKVNLKKDSTKTREWLILGGLWENRLQYDSAITAYRRAAEIESTCIKCKQHLASALAIKGSITEAIKIYEEALTSDSSNISLRSDYARLLKRDSRFLQAYRQFEHLIRSDSTNYYIWEQLGDCAMRIDSIAIGLQAYNTSFELNPANAPLALKLINGFINSGIPPFIVMPIAELAYQQDTTYLPIIRVKGYLQFLSQNYEDAEKWLEKGYLSGDTTRFMLKFLGITKYHRGSYLTATKILERAFERDTSDNVLNYILAKSCIEVGDWRRAIELINLTEDLLTPDSIEIAVLYATRGEAYNKSGQYVNAISNFEKALNLHPSYKAYLFEIGHCYYNAKEYELAKKTIEDFLTIAEQKPIQKSTSDKIGYAKHLLKIINGEVFFLDRDNVKIRETNSE